jgi:hypothetical protein
MDNLFKLDLKEINRSAKISTSVSRLRTRKPVLFQINSDKEQISRTPLKTMKGNKQDAK